MLYTPSKHGHTASTIKITRWLVSRNTSINLVGLKFHRKMPGVCFYRLSAVAWSVQSGSVMLLI